MSHTTDTFQSVLIRPWEADSSLPEKPDISPYGYIRDGVVYECDEEQLIDQFQQEPYQFLWTPKSELLIRPESAPELLGVYRNFALKASRGTLIWGVVLTVGSLLLVIGFQDWHFITRNLLFALGCGLLAMGLWDFRKAQNFTQTDALQMADEARFNIWFEDENHYRFTFTNIIAVVFVAVLAGQFLFRGDDYLGIQAGALVKPLVLKGEYWRLLTGTVMHGSLLHCWMNTMAWLDFGRRCETLANPAFVPLVFFVSALSGSILSLIFYPNTTSVGASGGILGMLGFLLVASWRRPDAFPKSFIRTSMRNIVWIGVLGLAGFAFIDNAAHLGGLIGGAVIGRLFIDKKGSDFPIPTSKLQQQIGWAALSMVLCTGAVTLWKLKYG